MNKQELLRKVQHTVHQLVQDKGYASAVDLFVAMGKITPKLVEEWRFGRVPYLERVVNGSLGQLSTIMAYFRETANEMDLSPSYSFYKRWGKGPKQPLYFSKSRNPSIEKHYATHYVARKSEKPSDAGDSN